MFEIQSVDFQFREGEERIFDCLIEDPEKYPENTSLQRNARKYLMQGGRLGSGLGVIICRLGKMLLFTPFTETSQKFISDCLRQWNFGLYVSEFWHIHAKTPRGIEPCE